MSSPCSRIAISIVCTNRGWQFDIVEEKLEQPHRMVVCYAESRDGIEWRKPELGLVDFEGSKRNNIIWDGIGSHNFTPFKDANPDCPETECYKAIGGIKSEGGLFAFASSDGIHWTLVQEKPIITKGYFDSQNLAFWDSERSEYRAYYRDLQNYPHGRDILTATSRDFVNWQEFPFLEYDPERYTELYTNQILPYYRAPHILLGFPMRYIERGESMTGLNKASVPGEGPIREGTDRHRLHDQPRRSTLQGLGRSLRPDRGHSERISAAGPMPTPSRAVGHGGDGLCRGGNAAGALVLHPGRLLDRKECPYAAGHAPNRRLRLHSCPPLGG